MSVAAWMVDTLVDITLMQVYQDKEKTVRGTKKRFRLQALISHAARGFTALVHHVPPTGAEGKPGK